VIRPDAPDQEGEERSNPTVSRRVILWLVVASLAGLYLPGYLIFSAIRDQNLSLQGELAQIQGTLEGDQPLNPTVQALQDSLEQARDQLNAVQSVRSTLATSHINWPVTMAAIGSYDQSQMMLVGVTQTDNRIVLTGQADDESVVTTYTRRLEQSNLFSRVIVQSMTLNRVPTPTPVSTTPGTGQTPTPLAGGETVLNPDFRSTFVEFVIMVELKTAQP
jgi:hypothetical protein